MVWASLGIDALANGWVGTRDVIKVWAWMHWPMVGSVAWTLSRFGHGAGGHDADLSDRQKVGQTRAIDPRTRTRITQIKRMTTQTIIKPS